MMEVLCVLSAQDGFSGSYCACPFGQVNAGASDKPCPWRNADRCGYTANRHDLMKSLSLLSAKVFEMSRKNNLPPDKTTETCMLLDSARRLLDNSLNSR